MPQTLSLNLVHLIFSTKDRAPFLTGKFCEAMHAYLAVVVRDRKCDCFRVGGIADHVHLAIRLHPTLSLAKLVQELKAYSSKWAKQQGMGAFSWQRGYGAFSVSPRDREALLQYIDTQEAHHMKRSFQDEMRAFLKQYHIDFDEQYLWD